MLVRRHIWTNENWCSLAVPASQPTRQSIQRVHQAVKAVGSTLKCVTNFETSMTKFYASSVPGFHPYSLKVTTFKSRFKHLCTVPTARTAPSPPECHNIRHQSRRVHSNEVSCTQWGLQSERNETNQTEIMARAIKESHYILAAS